MPKHAQQERRRYLVALPLIALAAGLTAAFLWPASGPHVPLGDTLGTGPPSGLQVPSRGRPLLPRAVFQPQRQSPLKATTGATERLTVMKEHRKVPVPAVASGSPQAIAMAILKARGWGSQYGCLAAIIGHESGWDITATNPGTGAYGLPQALPGSKMSTAGAGWQTSATVQLTWMVNYYIAPVYKTPCDAWAFWQGHGYY